MTHDFAGTVALATGAGSGIGQATASAFARAGARVVVADVNPHGIAGTRRQLAAIDGGYLAC